MKNAIGWICFSAALALLFLGCSKKEEEAANEPVESQKTAETKTGGNENACTLDQIIALWDGGQAGEAVEKFVRVSWDGPNLYEKGSVFSLSEKEFLALSRSEQESLSQKAMKNTGSLKKMVRQAVSEGQTYRSKGDAEQARKYFSAVKQCGESLNTDKHLLIIKMNGKAIQELGDRELNGI